MDLEPELPRQRDHRAVGREDLGDDLVEALRPRDLDEPSQQLAPETEALVGVADDERHLGRCAGRADG